VTARDYLRRRKRLAIYGQCASALLLFVGSDLVGRLPFAKGLPSYAIPFAMMVPFAVGMVLSAGLPACPACRVSLYDFRIRPRKKHQVNFCPYCALRLDEPLLESKAG
jgi:hypothetical protein